MESQWLETLNTSLRSLPSRRHVLRGFASAGLVFIGHRQADDAGAKNVHRQKKQKKKKHHKAPQQPVSPPPPPPPLPFNAFGCLDVGQPCQGDSTLCCSGICDPGTSTCVAHHADVCQTDADSCTAGVVIPCKPNNSTCLCTVTTGGAAFCADTSKLTDLTDLCRFCNQDTDCEEEFGPGAACVVLGGICSPFCPSTDRTACLPPCA